MIIELKNFVIEFDKEISYMPSIIQTLENNVDEILVFFALPKLSKKKKVVIYTDREKYKEHILSHVPEFKEWMCADTYDGNINLLDINEARKSKEHEDMDIDKFVKCILHEFVHSCQQEWSTDSKDNYWYWEALATNLSGQDFSTTNLASCDFEKLKYDFVNTARGYVYSYTLGNILLEIYSKDKLLEYVKNPELLRKEADQIFEFAKKHQIDKKK